MRARLLRRAQTTIVGSRRPDARANDRERHQSTDVNGRQTEGTTSVMILASAALAVMLGQVPGFPNNCPKCGVVSYVDLPNDGATATEGLYIAGWGFECESGAAADRVDVFYQGDDGVFVPAGGSGAPGNGEVYGRLVRPDG